MSYFIVYDVFVKSLKLKGAELLIFAAIYNAVANMDGYISMSRIALVTGLSRKHVSETIKKFEENGFIGRSASGYRRKNKYTLNSILIGTRKEPVPMDKCPQVATVNNSNILPQVASTRVRRLLPKANKL